LHHFFGESELYLDILIIWHRIHLLLCKLKLDTVMVDGRHLVLLLVNDQLAAISVKSVDHPIRQDKDHAVLSASPILDVDLAVKLFVWHLQFWLLAVCFLAEVLAELLYELHFSLLLGRQVLVWQAQLAAGLCVLFDQFELLGVLSERLRFIVEVSTGHPVGKDVTQTVLLTVVDPFVDENGRLHGCLERSLNSGSRFAFEYAFLVPSYLCRALWVKVNRICVQDLGRVPHDLRQAVHRASLLHHGLLAFDGKR
jgi:hypothetical protein